MSPAGRIGAFLRNRRIAMVLIICVSLASAFGTLPGNRDWYGHPAFVGLLAWLTLATAACSWERTALALRLARHPGEIPATLASRLRDHPQLTVPVHDRTAEQVADALADAGLRVRRGPALVAGWSGRIGLLGSPLFHWSLVALFVVIVAGQATLSSGLLGVPAGGEVVERADSYGTLSTGPLFPGHSRLTLAVTEWSRTYVVDGVDRGPVPTVVVSRGDTELARRRVYANSPLRHGSMLVHMNDWGLAARVSIETTAAETLDRFPVLVDFADDERARMTPALLDYTDETGRAWRLSIELVPPADPSSASSSADASSAPGSAFPADALVRVGAAGGSEGKEHRLAAGERLELPDGTALRYEGAGPYARLSVVRDWSVLPIYALLVTATIGLALSLLVPYRAVWVLLADKDGQRVLNVVIRQLRRDPLFVERVESVLAPAAPGAPPASVSQSKEGASSR